VVWWIIAEGREGGGRSMVQRKVEGKNALDFNRHARKLRRFENPLARRLKRGVAKHRMPGNNSRVDHFSGLADEYLHLYGARSPGVFRNRRIRRFAVLFFSFLPSFPPPPHLLLCMHLIS